MKLIVQRVSHANVVVDNEIVGKIGKGFLVLCGITHTDTKENADFLAKKLCNLIRSFLKKLGFRNLFKASKPSKSSSSVL